jgi:hypothetical protein
MEERKGRKEKGKLEKLWRRANRWKEEPTNTLNKSKKAWL